jgi:hypothetical protein
MYYYTFNIIFEENFIEFNYKYICKYIKQHIYIHTILFYQLLKIIIIKFIITIITFQYKTVLTVILYLLYFVLIK